MADSLVPQRWIEASAPVVAPEPEIAPAGQEDAVKKALEFVGLIRRHALLVLMLTLGSFMIAWYVVRSETPRYAANGVVRLSDKGRMVSAAGSPSAQPIRSFGDPVLSQIQILQSRAIAKDVVQQQGLRLHSVNPRQFAVGGLLDVQVSDSTPADTISLRFYPTEVEAHSDRIVVRSPYGQPLLIQGVQFTVPRRPAVDHADLAVLPLEVAVSQVLSNLRGHQRERTDIIDVSYVAEDPLLAQRAVNSAVQAFQKFSVTSAKAEWVRRREFIADQLQKAEVALAGAQSAHDAFRSSAKVYSSRDKFQNEQASINATVSHRQELEAERDMLLTLLDSLAAARRGGFQSGRLAALTGAPTLSGNMFISQLFGELLRYESLRDSLAIGHWARSATSPDVMRLDTLIARADTQVVIAVRGQVASLSARIGALKSLETRDASSMEALPEAESKEAGLLAQVDMYQKESARLRDQLQDVQINEAAEAGQVEVVDLAALPGGLVGSGRTAKLLLGALLGFAFGTAIAYVLENWKSVIRRRDELDSLINFPSLVLVPQIKQLSSTGRSFLPKLSKNGNGTAAQSTERTELITLTDRRSAGAEAYRTLRTNLLFSAAVRSVSRIVVTSPGVAEGKSTTAGNLAVAFAQQGHNVLLIDCDLRRSRIHKMFGVENLPGLTNVLAAGVDLDAAIRPTHVERLSVLPAGTTPPNPAELLGSDQMHTLLETLGRRFEIIIIDTPPLLAASDAAILSRMVDGAILVVRAGMTERSALQTAAQQLATVGARVLGTVLNDPDAEVPKYATYDGYYYYYGYQYYHSNA